MQPYPTTARAGRAWLTHYLCQVHPRTRRGNRYLQAIANTAWQGDLSDPGTGDSEDLRLAAYNHSREGAGHIGRAAFLFHHPHTRWHARPELRDWALHGLQTFRQQQDDAGRFIWGSGHYYQWGSHEHVWRLEPLLMARVWLEPTLSSKDRKWIDAMLRRAADWLRAAADDPIKNLQFNNRGAVWCAGARLCGLYFNDAQLLRAADEHAQVILPRVVDEQGQVKEATLQYLGGGPDSNYTYTGWTYVHLYRAWGGQMLDDERRLAAVRWLVQSNTRDGHALASANSVRFACYPVGKIVDTLAALEMYSPREPWLSKVIDQWWPTISKRHAVGHCVHGALWAYLAHERDIPAAPPPRWARDFAGHYDNPPCSYSLFAQRYQTGVVYRGIHPAKGLQCFAWGSEAPLVQHTDTRASGSRAGQWDTARDSIDAGNEGWEMLLRRAGAGDGYEAPGLGTVVSTRRGKLWELYAFTPAAVVLMVGYAGRGVLRSRWVLHEATLAQLQLNARQRTLSRAGSQAQLQWWRHGRCELKRDVLHLTAPEGLQVFILSNHDAKIGRVDRRALQLWFTDASGAYTLNFNRVIDHDGKVNRRLWNRLKRVP